MYRGGCLASTYEFAAVRVILFLLVGNVSPAVLYVLARTCAVSLLSRPCSAARRGYRHFAGEQETWRARHTPVQEAVNSSSSPC